MALHGSLKDALIAVGAFDLSGVSNQGSFECKVEELDSTTFGNNSRRKLPGLLDGSLSAACYWSKAEFEDAALAGLVSANDDTGALTWAASKTTNARGYIASGCTYQAERGGAIGEILPGSLAINFKREHVPAFISEPGVVDRSISGNGAFENLGTLSATQNLYATLHVFRVNVAGTIDIVIESDDADGFPSATTRITFPQVTSAVASYFRSVAGPITPDNRFRARWTIGGSGSYRFIVGIGVR